jgi:hypothetical protein
MTNQNNKLVSFDSLDVGARFFDPSTAEDFSKVCGNAAEILKGGNYHTGHLCTFEKSELVQPTEGL